MGYVMDYIKNGIQEDRSERKKTIKMEKKMDYVGLGMKMVN